jgi:hypothetical protein
MAIFFPSGSEVDETRKPGFYDETYAFLRECGISELNSIACSLQTQSPGPTRMQRSARETHALI